LISKFSGGACPHTPLAARASSARVPPHLYYPCYGGKKHTAPFSSLSRDMLKQGRQQGQW